MNGENKPIGPAPLPDNSQNRNFNSPPSPPSSTPPPPPRGTPSGPPPPPPPQIDIRTMASDAQSLKSSGGLGTESKTFSPADLAKEPVFTSEIVSPAGAATVRDGSGKKIGLALGALAILLAAAAIGYYFVWPLFSGNEASQETVVAPPPTLPTETPPAAPAHQSYFTKPPTSGGKQVTLNSLTATSLASSLKASSGDASSLGTVKEIFLNTDSNTSITSSQILGVLVPGSGLEAYLEPDVTAFVYYNNNKAYPGYIFKLKNGADLKAAGTASANIEKSANLSAFYPDSPGAVKGSWKSGNVSGVQTRYVAYASAGASLNYGWVGNYLVISTSFDGFKKALELLPR